MPYLTRQEILDKVVEFLSKQGRPSISEEGVCMYRTEDGARCAVGIFIPDELYNPQMEETTVCQLIEQYPGVLEAGGIDTNKDLVFMGDLQTAHDNTANRPAPGTSTFMDALLVRLRRVAEMYNLVLRSN